MDKKKYLRLNITTWNANGIIKQKEELIHYLKETNTDVLLVQETFLKQKHNFKIPNYTVHRNDRQELGGGTAIIIRTKIPHTQITSPKTTNLETTVIKIHETDLTLVSIYKRPGNTITQTDFDDIFHLGKRIIAGGDFNAKHTTWNSNSTNSEGKKLRHIIDNTPNTTIIAPTEPTHHTAQSQDIIDLFLTKNTPMPQNCKVHQMLNSDHYPVQITLPLKDAICPREYEAITYDWKKYKRILTSHYSQNTTNINTNSTLDLAVEEWTRTLQKAIEKTSHKQNITHNNPIHIDSSTIDKIKHKNRLNREYKLTEQQYLKTQINKLTKEIKTEINKAREFTRKQFIEHIYDKHDGKEIYKIPEILKRTKTEMP